MKFGRTLLNISIFDKTLQIFCRTFYILWLFLRWLVWDCCRNHRRVVVWKNIFNMGASGAVTEFFQGFRFNLIYVSLIQSFWSDIIHFHGFHLFMLLSLFIEITFFCLYHQNNFFVSKVIFRQDSYRLKRVLESTKLAYGNKTKKYNKEVYHPSTPFAK